MCVCQYECRGVPEVNYLTLEPLLRAAAGQHLGLTETDVEVHLRLFTQNKLVLPCICSVHRFLNVVPYPIPPLRVLTCVMFSVPCSVLPCSARICPP